MKHFGGAADILVFLVIFAAAGAWFWHDDGREVIDFGQAIEASAEDGRAGSWIGVSIPVRKLRDCAIIQDGEGLQGYFDGETGSRPMNWRRDGGLLAPGEDVQFGKLQARIPQEAPPGPAYMVFEPRFKCRFREVPAYAPPIAFTVLEN